PGLVSWRFRHAALGLAHGVDAGLDRGDALLEPDARGRLDGDVGHGQQLVAVRGQILDFVNLAGHLASSPLAALSICRQRWRILIWANRWPFPASSADISSSRAISPFRAPQPESSIPAVGLSSFEKTKSMAA